MALGYDGKLYILAFDHRGSFQTAMFGIEGAPSAEQTTTIADAKHVIFEGLQFAVASGIEAEEAGVLVDEQFGGDVPRETRALGLTLSVAVERSSQKEFDFEYGPDWAAHIERLDPTFAKVLVRLNPDGDAGINTRQLARLKELSDWLHAHDRRFLFELLVPAEPAQLEAAGGDADRYDAELRPALMVRAIAQIQAAGIEPDVWKIEGIEARADAERIARQARSGAGREGVRCVVLGRGADDAKVDHWLRESAPVEGFIGFAIGRSIWWDALEQHLKGAIAREDAVKRIGQNYLRFVGVYDEAEAGAPVARGG
jgi:myo-inositol catabolism protein IolC